MKWLRNSELSSVDASDQKHFIQNQLQIKLCSLNFKVIHNSMILYDTISPV